MQFSRISNHTANALSIRVGTISHDTSFGSAISEMQFSSDTTSKYRYGFNNQEKDDEVVGGGDYYAFEYRIQDARLGRFLSVDLLSKKYPYYTPYQFGANQPILSVDIEGLESSNDKNPTLTDAHRYFFNDIGIILYQAYRSGCVNAKNRENQNTVNKNVWSVQAALFCLTLSATEASYGNKSLYTSNSKAMNNYWGMGDAGATRIMYSCFEEGFGDWIYDMTTRWGNAVKLMESGNFTSDEMNRALNSFIYNKYPAYNTDKNLNGDWVDYAGSIMARDFMGNVAKRFIQVLDENITSLNNDYSNLSKKYSDLYSSPLSQEDKEEQNEHFVEILMGLYVTERDKKLGELKTQMNAVLETKEKLIQIKDEIDSSMD